jgi:glycosyltransferase involved in cell wall biosynthesis
MKKIIFLSNHFIALYKFRKELILELVKKQHDVYLVLPESSENDYFNKMGCKIITVDVDRRGLNPVADLTLFINYLKIFKKIKPDLILSYTIKPNIYGSLASTILKMKQICNITGTGATFFEENFLSNLVKILYRFSVKNSYKVFFQNRSDLDFFVKNHLVKDNYELIPGSGVNIDEYPYLPDRKPINFTFLFLGRIMKIKGIDEYLIAAKNIKKNNPKINFYVAGFIEEQKYEEIIKNYVDNGIIEYFGYRDDVKKMFEISTCLVLPSHGGEGIPNVVLEAAAYGKICLVSNVCGSTDVIVDYSNGFVFEPKNNEDLIDKMHNILYEKQTEIDKIILKNRKIVENKFDRKIVMKKYIELIEGDK